MTRIPVLVPKATLSMEQATILRWMKASGDSVQVDDTLLELETDKAVVEVPSPAAGTLSIVIPTGEVGVEQTIGWIANSESGAQAATVSLTEKSSSFRVVDSAVDRSSDPAAPRPPGVVATPAAKRRAAELAIALSRVVGTGPGGRITEDDVNQAAATVGAVVSDSRRTLAEQVTKSWQSVPHIHIARHMDAAGLIQAKQLASAATSEQITFTDLLLFSVARTLADFPQIVALDENSKQAAINVAFAVATPENNVVTPVLSGANVLSLTELGLSRRELTDLALSRSLRVKHLKGGQFTVSNLGMEGADFFAPIINSPQRAILALGRIAQIPVVVANVIEPGWRMWANLAADHRYVDGAMAARFLSRWQENLRTLPEDLGK